MKRAAVLAGVLFACQSADDQFVVVIDSDLAFPSEIASIEIAAYARGASEGDGAVIDLSRTGLPASIGVMPLDGEDPLVVQAQGLDGSGGLVVARRAVIHERPEGLVRVALFLARACRSVICAEDETCTEMGCEAATISGRSMADIDEGNELADLCRPGEGQCRPGGDGYEKCERFGGDRVNVACPQDTVCDPETLACVDRDDKPMVTVEVEKIGQGAGYVHSLDGVLDCGPTCRVEVPRGSLIDLRAMPDGPSSFVGWGGDCSGPGSCTFTANEDSFVDARFEVGGGGTAQLEVGVGGSGTGRVVSNPPGFECNGGQCFGQFPYGTNVTLSAEPTGSSGFSGWFGDCAGRDSCTIRMDGPRWVSANFVWDDGGPNVRLDVLPGGSGFGRVRSEPAGIDCGTSCTFSFPRNTNVRLVATPEPGHQFIEWQGACAGFGDCYVDLATNLEVFAMFHDPNAAWSVPHDVNGDGYADLVYGAPGAVGGSGAVYVSFGPQSQSSLDAAAADRRYTGTEIGAGFGSTIGVGDLDGDGFDDIAIGAPRYQGRGAVFIVFGGPGIIGSTTLVNSGVPTIMGETVGDTFGAAIAVDDMDADGVAELLIGAPGDTPAAFGKAYAFPGGPGFLPMITSSFRFQAQQAGSAFGAAIAIIGDVDLDGWADLAIGEPKWSPNGDSRGRVGLYFGRANPANPNTSPNPDVVLSGENAMDVIGWSITRLGDFNVDGLDDFAIGSPFNDKVHVFYGRTSWSSGTALGSPVFSDVGWFGASIAGGEDVDGDGTPDLVVGAPFADGTDGRAHVIFGGQTPTTGLVIDGSCVDAARCTIEQFGFTVAVGPDVDANGVSDVVIGSRYGGASAGALERGRIGVFPIQTYMGSSTLLSESARVEILGEDAMMGWCAALPGSPVYQ